MDELIDKLIGYENIILNISQLENIFNFRLTGIIDYKIKKKSITATDEMKELINSICLINETRNIALKHEVIKLDAFLLKNNVPRLWLKGMRDILNDKSQVQQRKRKILDSDLIVEKDYPIRELIFDYGMVHGILDRNGEFCTVPIDEILEQEKGHYEYAPLMKKIYLQNFEHLDIPIKILNRFRVFKDAESELFYTDFTVDVHHALANGVDINNKLIINQPLPLMNDIDDTWYAMNKSYYEVYKGDSKDVQLLYLTFKKYNTFIDNNILKDRMKVICPKIYNENVFIFFEKLKVKNQVIQDELFKKLNEGI